MLPLKIKIKMIDFTCNIGIGQTYLPRFIIIVEFLKTQLASI